MDIITDKFKTFLENEIKLLAKGQNEASLHGNFSLALESSIERSVYDTLLKQMDDPECEWVRSTAI